MTSLGVCMAPRDFVCPLCGRKFTRVTADLILLEDTVCDSCLAEMGPLNGAARRERINQRLAELNRQEPH